MPGEKVLELVLQLFSRRASSRLCERMADNRAFQREFLVLAALQNPQVDGIDRSGDGKRSDQSLQRQPPGQARPERWAVGNEGAPPHSWRSSITYPMPRTVWISLTSKGSSSFARSRRTATSTTFVSLSKLMSHTCSAITVRDRTSPRRRSSSESRLNSLGVSSSRLPARVAFRRARSTSRSANRRLVGSCPSRSPPPRRNRAWTRADNSENENGLTR
mmetsp:Transcript_61822/g.146364  ORF Transcript_61822/g.146364 Transcript_61822/m.146364 type:complete len:218 (-) Transcript_61822:3895-4548(-)